MKRYTAILILFALSAVIVGMGSCAKKKTPDTTAGKMVGNWKKIQFATDDNASGVIEQSEISNQPSAIDDELFFRSDNTGTETTIINKNKTAESVLNFSWSLVGESLTVIYTANDTVAYAIVNVNSSNLIVTTKTSIGLAWYSYAKQ